MRIAMPIRPCRATDGWYTRVQITRETQHDERGLKREFFIHIPACRPALLQSSPVAVGQTGRWFVLLARVFVFSDDGVEGCSVGTGQLSSNNT